MGFHVVTYFTKIKHQLPQFPISSSCYLEVLVSITVNIKLLQKSASKQLKTQVSFSFGFMCIFLIKQKLLRKNVIRHTFFLKNLNIYSPITQIKA